MKSRQGSLNCERLPKAIGEVAALVAIDSPGLKGPCIGVEAWHHEKNLGEAIGEA